METNVDNVFDDSIKSIELELSKDDSKNQTYNNQTKIVLNGYDGLVERIDRIMVIKDGRQLLTE